jgi:DNA ligase-1
MGDRDRRNAQRNTVDRFGPVREVVQERERGLVFEVAFEGLQRSARHRSGVAMRFPRISRLRFDKQPGDADRLETLLQCWRRPSGRPLRAGASSKRRRRAPGAARAGDPQSI